MNKHKPCPFCGSDNVGEKEWSWAGGMSILMGWYDRDCYLDVEGYGCRECGVDYPEALWNNRPIEDALNTRIAEFEKQIHDLKAKNTALLKKLQPFPEQELCKRCGRQDGVGWFIADDVWEQLTEGLNINTLCLQCADELAKAKGMSQFKASIFFGGNNLTSVNVIDLQTRNTEVKVQQREEERIIDQLLQYIYSNGPMFEGCSHCPSGVFDDECAEYCITGTETEEERHEYCFNKLKHWAYLP